MIAQALLELAEKLKTFEADLEGIRRHVEELEEENAFLRTILKDQSIKLSGLDNLREMHRAGYHICNAHFGAKRSDNCLFCEALLDK